MRAALVLMTLATALGSGCGPNCQSACQKVYAPDECNVPTPGQEWEEAYEDCMRECENAMRYPAAPDEQGDYDPQVKNTSGESITLRNEQEAAAWMDCVLESACDRLEEGYCPI